MSPQLNFYRDRAAEAARDAAEAKLDNVRERCLRAEEAWLGMAARIERSERLRADTAAHKAASVGAASVGAASASAVTDIEIVGDPELVD